MPSYQDPYLRLVVARTPGELRESVDAVDRAIEAGVREASAFLFTFGMTEVFRNAESRKIVNQKPGYAGSDGGAGKVERAAPSKRTSTISAQLSVSCARRSPVPRSS